MSCSSTCAGVQVSALSERSAMRSANFRTASRPHARAHPSHHAGGARRGKQRLLPARGSFGEQREAGISEAALRHADGPDKGFIVEWVRHQAKVGEQILDLTAVVEADRADD